MRKTIDSATVRERAGPGLFDASKPKGPSSFRVVTFRRCPFFSRFEVGLNAAYSPHPEGGLPGQSKSAAKVCD